MFSKFLLLAGTALLLTGCVTDGGPTDVKGRSLKIESEGAFQPSESRFNTFAFLKPSGEYLTEAKERNNGQGWMETIIWDSGRSFVMIEFINVAWFAPSEERRMADIEVFRELSKRFPVPDDSFVELDQVSPRTKGWFATSGPCSVGSFAKRFKGLTPYDNDHGNADAIVRFGTCGDDLVVSPEQFVQGIDLMTDKDKEQIANSFVGMPPLVARSTPVAKKPLVSLKGSWDGVAENLRGTVTRETAAQIEFTFSLPNENTKCDGVTVNANKTTETGRWTFDCTNGLTADGIWTNRASQAFTASGSDTEKRKISFTLGS